jgi:hypothetical protein
MGPTDREQKRAAGGVIGISPIRTGVLQMSSKLINVPFRESGRCY